MEETKIWVDEGTSATELDTANQLSTEELLGDILAASSDMLEEGLQLVGGQTSTESGRVDLHARDS